MSAVGWCVTAVLAWIALAVVTGPVMGRLLRDRHEDRDVDR